MKGVDAEALEAALNSLRQRSLAFMKANARGGWKSQIDTNGFLFMGALDLLLFAKAISKKEWSSMGDDWAIEWAHVIKEAAKNREYLENA